MEEIIEIVLEVAGYLPAIAILTACIIYISRRKGIDSILLLVGQSLSMLIMLAWRFGYRSLLDNGDGFGMRGDFMFYQRIMLVGSTLAHLVFASGLLLLVLKQRRESAPPPLY
ncbi:MAG TPA: hypothetical protein PK760_03995 [Flavobacteriales bacterium]|nr:hypothetical protein [Flavobacteriales bacterium]